jgi:hypothetical protein
MPDPSVFPNATVTTPGGDVTYARAYTGPTAAPAPVPAPASNATFSGAEGVDAVTNANFPAGTNVNPTTPSHQQLVRILLRQVKELKTYLPNRGVLISLLEKPQ